MDSVVAVGNQFMREVNSAAVLSALRSSAEASVSEISRATGLSRQAVSRSLSALEEAGLVEFLAPDRSVERMGRPAQQVRFRAEIGHVVGVGISPDEIHAGVSDIAGRVVGEAKRPVGRDNHVESLVTSVEDALRSAGLSRTDVWAVSVGTPGVVDPVTGRVQLVPSMPGLVGDVLIRELRSHFDCPVHVDNDIKLATEGEQWEGDHGHDGSMVLIHWGDRVGAGIVLSGQLLRGSSNDAGDIGFLDFIVPPGTGAPAIDDGLGMFEAWVGAREFLRVAGITTGIEPGQESAADLRPALDTAIDAAQQGSPEVLDAIEEMASRLTYGLVAIRALLDPAVIVIGGPMSRLGELLTDRLAAQLERQPLNMPRLALTSLDHDAVMFGAIRHGLTAAHRDGVPRRP